MSVALIQGDARALPLADASVQCVVTSPPYWGLRDYAGEQRGVWGGEAEHEHEWIVQHVGGEGYAGGTRTRWQHVGGRAGMPEGGYEEQTRQGDSCSCGAWYGALGLEPTPELYVAHMVEVFREVRRVLRPDGTLWLNLGDSRRDKQWLGMPHLVRAALQADGWRWADEIVWSKPNPMPESVRDRTTRAHEFVFLMVKQQRYFYDADAIKVSVSANTHARITQAALQEQQGGPKSDAYEANAPGRSKRDRRPADIVKAMGRKPEVNPKAAANSPGSKQNESFSAATAGPVLERNARSVWTIATQPYPGAHFATYPEKLVEPCILAGSSPKACGVCAAPWERVTERTEELDHTAKGSTFDGGKTGARDGGDRTQSGPRYVSRPTGGWRSTCEHDDDSGSCLVFDPFNGSGTTGRVAGRFGRRYVGVDISREYLAEQASHRLGIAALVNLDIERGEVERQLRMPL